MNTADHSDISEVTIRAGTSTDTPQLLKLVEELATFHGDTANVDFRRFKVDAFGFDPWFTVLVAEIDQQLVGYALLNRLYKAQLCHRGLDLHHLHVTADQRGKGIGRALVEAALNEARALECDFFNVGVHPANENARRFYARFGFEDAASTNLRLRIKIAG